MSACLDKAFEQQFDVDQPLLHKVLRAYFPNVQYLKSATVTGADGLLPSGSLVSAQCEFGIDESCYINDTGHFNSVEFNICYNQMMYYTIAKSVKHELMDGFKNWSLDDFFRKQLPDILIVNFQSKFKQPINPRKFTGAIDFLETRLMNRGNPILYVKTRCRFADDEGGQCEGAVDLVIVNPL